MSTLRLEATVQTDIGGLLPELASALNRRTEPPVAVTADHDRLCFRAETWQPILLARVEDALDELLGSAWSGRFRWV